METKIITTPARIKYNHSFGLNPFSLKTDTKKNALSAIAAQNNIQKQITDIPVHLTIKATRSKPKPLYNNVCFDFIFLRKTCEKTMPDIG